MTENETVAGKVVPVADWRPEVACRPPTETVADVEVPADGLKEKSAMVN